jgi:hypothetical protein
MQNLGGGASTQAKTDKKTQRSHPYLNNTLLDNRQ